jgi:putative PIN family toxin of toxin-antitoxin system
LKVVLDTNSLLVSIGRKSKYRPIFDALLEGKITLLISNDIINEYVEIIEDKTNAIVANNIADLLVSSPNVEEVKVYFKWAIITEDADDNKFVDCALNGQAKFLVTDDKRECSSKCVCRGGTEIQSIDFHRLTVNQNHARHSLMNTP